MASTNKTPHLGLCQWVKTDPLLMDDMNDTLKTIDEVTARKCQLDLIKEEVLSQRTDTWEIDVSDIQWSKYSLVAVKVLLKGYGYGIFSVDPASKQRGYIPGKTDAVSGLCSIPYEGRPVHIFFAPDGGADEVSSLTVSATNLYIGGAEGTSYNSLTAFRIAPTSSGNSMTAGSRVKIWGLK